MQQLFIAIKLIMGLKLRGLYQNQSANLQYFHFGLTQLVELLSTSNVVIERYLYKNF
jgi:hypothetical protein